MAPSRDVAERDISSCRNLQPQNLRRLNCGAGVGPHHVIFLPLVLLYRRGELEPTNGRGRRRSRTLGERQFQASASSREWARPGSQAGPLPRSTGRASSVSSRIRRQSHRPGKSGGGGLWRRNVATRSDGYSFVRKTISASSRLHLFIAALPVFQPATEEKTGTAHRRMVLIVVILIMVNHLRDFVLGR